MDPGSVLLSTPRILVPKVGSRMEEVSTTAVHGMARMLSKMKPVPTPRNSAELFVVHLRVFGTLGTHTSVILILKIYMISAIDSLLTNSILIWIM